LLSRPRFPRGSRDRVQVRRGALKALAKISVWCHGTVWRFFTPGDCVFPAGVVQTAAAMSRGSFFCPITMSGF
jgi:hypothetical protein